MTITVRQQHPEHGKPVLHEDIGTYGTTRFEVTGDVFQDGLRRCVSVAICDTPQEARDFIASHRG